MVNGSDTLGPFNSIKRKMIEEGVITESEQEIPYFNYIRNAPDEKLPVMLKSFCKKYAVKYLGGDVREFLLYQAAEVWKAEQAAEQYEVVTPEPEVVTAAEVVEKIATIEQREAEYTKLRAEHSNDNCTDYGNSDRFIVQNGNNVRFCPQFDSWFIWTDQEGRWKKDVNGYIQELAKKTIRSIFDEARLAPDDATSKHLAKWAMKCETTSHTTALISLAKTDLYVVINHEMFDSDHNILNVKNGIYDFTTHTLKPHDKSKFLTRLCPVEYSPDATCPNFTRFLNRIFQSHPDIIPYLKRAVGYSLTGNVQEHVLFLLHGSGSNGKSTLLFVLSELMGDYGATTESATFTTDRGDSVRNDIARLVGTRLVSASENTIDSKLDETLIKQLSGGDKVTARFLFKEYFEYFPTFKIWWCFNHTPLISDTTNSTWRRIHLIPFTETISDDEMDKTLREKLVVEELPGILNWAIEGLKDYQKNGLKPPLIVMDTTKDYRNDQDILFDFLNEMCEFAPDDQKFGDSYSIKGSELYAALVSWYSYQGEKPMSGTKFGRLLVERGLKKERSNRGIYYHGIRIRRGKYAV
jgi:putative DNA primase/helicase